MDILRDFDGDVGLCLWKVLRRVHGRIQDGSNTNPGLACREAIDAAFSSFGEAAPAVAMLVGVEGEAPPDDGCLAAACEVVRVWCEEADHYRTGALFAEAAAYLTPTDPAAANTAARSCRQAVLYHRSAQWYQRGRSLAVRAKNREEAVRSLLGAGLLMYHLGHHGNARRYLQQAKTSAIHTGRRLQAGKAEHNLLLLAAEERRFQTGLHHAAQALQLYPRGYHRVPHLAHDYAHFLTRLGIYAPALPILSIVARLLPRASDQVLIASTIARAAAGLGQIEVYDEAAERVLALIEEADLNASHAYKNLAVGAWHLGAWERAAAFAARTIEIATLRHEREPLHSAKRLCSMIAERVPAPPPRDPPPGTMLEAVQRRCLMGLRVWERRTTQASDVPNGTSAAPQRTTRGESRLIPPPPVQDGDGAEPAGMEILREFDGDVGLCLWKAVRRVHGRIQDGSNTNPGLACREAIDAAFSSFGEAAPAVAMLVGVEGEAPPDDGCLAAACEVVRVWCEEADHYRTGALFAEAAAYLTPTDPAAANTAARSCRQAVLYHRSAHWYQRGRSLALRAKSRGEAVRSLLGAGLLMYHLGHFATARRYLQKAKTSAIHTGRRLQAGKAEHNLLLLAAEERRFQTGLHHAAQALQLYPRGYHRVPHLAHDYAHFLTRLRIYAPALPILSIVARLLPRASEQVLIASTIARAAAGLGQIQVYDEAAERVLTLIKEADLNASHAYTNLAVGAWQLGAWERAAAFATLTIEIATPRHEREPLHSAKRLCSMIAERVPAPPPRDPPSGTMLEALQRRCLVGLRVWERQTARRTGAPNVP